MAYAVVARDGDDPSRRAAFRDRHIAAIEGFAREGLLLLGLPLHGADGRSLGSLMVVAAADQAGLDAYLVREPFMAGGVWRDVACRPLRIPVLPWRPWPATDAPRDPGRGHTILLVEGAADLDRLGPAAADGTLVFAGETTDTPGAVMVTAHATDAQAAAWVAADPVLRALPVTIHATLLRPLPYLPLPGAG